MESIAGLFDPNCQLEITNPSACTTLTNAESELIFGMLLRSKIGSSDRPGEIGAHMYFQNYVRAI